MPSNSSAIIVSSSLIPSWNLSAATVNEHKLTEYVGAVDAGRAQDLFAAGMLRDEGHDIVDAAVDYGPGVDLRIV